ncbi:MAG TPA: hypothetical protein VIK14_15860 [Ignavibacteria bacterium]
MHNQENKSYQFSEWIYDIVNTKLITLFDLLKGYTEYQKIIMDTVREIMFLNFNYSGDYTNIIGEKSSCEKFIKEYFSIDRYYNLPDYQPLIIHYSQEQVEFTLNYSYYTFKKFNHISRGSSPIEKVAYKIICKHDNFKVRFYDITMNYPDYCSKKSFLCLPIYFINLSESNYLNALASYSTGSLLIVNNANMEYNLNTYKELLQNYEKYNTLILTNCDIFKEKTSENVKNILNNFPVENIIDRTNKDWKEDLTKLINLKHKLNRKKINSQKNIANDYVLPKLKNIENNINSSILKLNNENIVEKNIKALFEIYIKEKNYLFKNISNALFECINKVFNLPELKEFLKTEFKNIDFNKTTWEDNKDILRKFLEITKYFNGLSVWEELNLIIYKEIRQGLNDHLKKNLQIKDLKDINYEINDDFITNEELVRMELLFTEISFFKNHDLSKFNNLFKLLPYINLEVARVFQCNEIKEETYPKGDYQYVNISDYNKRMFTEFKLPKNILKAESKIFSAFSLIWGINKDLNIEINSIDDLSKSFVDFESNEFNTFYIATKKLSGEEEILYPDIDKDYILKFENGYFSNAESLIEYFTKSKTSNLLLYINHIMVSLLDHLLISLDEKMNINNDFILKGKLMDLKETIDTFYS